MINLFQQGLLDDFSEDQIHISAEHLLQLIAARGLSVSALFQIQHYASQSTHYLALVSADDSSESGQVNHPVCDCMMGVNLGIPCRHYYAVLRCRSSVQFHLGLFNQRLVV